MTRDNGLQEVCWIGRRSFDHAQLATHAHLKPILLTRGSLGVGLPERDMLVSPNHRFLVASTRTMLHFENHEALVAAKHLIDFRTIRPVSPLGVTYIHFTCDRHEVVLANGCWAESFHPWDQTLNGMGNAQRSELCEVFPDIAVLAGARPRSMTRRSRIPETSEQVRH